MHAVVWSLHLDPDPRELNADPADFAFLARIYAGPSDGPGEESFDVQVYSPEWLDRRCQTEAFVDARHTVVTTVASCSESALRAFLTRKVESCAGDTWDEVAEKVARLGLWEFEDYRE